MEDLVLFARVFEAPAGYEDVLALMSTPEERQFILRMKDAEIFDVAAFASAMNISLEDAQMALDRFYHRGFASLRCPKTYTKGTLYSRLDLFAQFEPELWGSVSAEKRQALDAWYLEEYGKRCMQGIVGKVQVRAMENYGLTPLPEPLLSNDVILPLDEALAWLETITRPIYLVPCNCRSIARNCTNPVDTCLLYPKETEYNSPVFRGYGTRLTIEEAKAVVLRAHKAGLVHTVGDTALCNCDHCCCYPFRSSKRLLSHGVWPAMKYRIDWNDERCVRCGLCVKRCHFGVFDVQRRTEKRIMRFDSSRCQGCGLCIDVCPKQALALEPLNTRVPSLV